MATAVFGSGKQSTLRELRGGAADFFPIEHPKRQRRINSRFLTKPSYLCVLATLREICVLPIQHPLRGTNVGALAFNRRNHIRVHSQPVAPYLEERRRINSWFLDQILIPLRLSVFA
jgi:hypothetical protein